MEESKPSPFGHKDYGRQSTPDETYPEKVLHVGAFCVLALGSIISFGWGLELVQNHFTSTFGVVVMFAGAFYSVVTWALLLVIVNISQHLRQIRHNTNKG